LQKHVLIQKELKTAFFLNALPHKIGAGDKKAIDTETDLYTKASTKHTLKRLCNDSASFKNYFALTSTRSDAEAMQPLRSCRKNAYLR